MKSAECHDQNSDFYWIEPGQNSDHSEEAGGPGSGRDFIDEYVDKFLFLPVKMFETLQSEYGDRYEVQLHSGKNNHSELRFCQNLLQIKSQTIIKGSG